MTPGAAAFLLLVVAQRLGELALARRNTARLMARGGREVGAGHYPFMVALHASWVACLVVFGHDEAVRPGWLVAYLLLQAFRAWILLSLGPRWTTRIVVADEPLVARGPFAWMRHPNYALVVAEIVVAPMVLGLLWVAVAFSVLNAAMLLVRIRAEDAALGRHEPPEQRVERP